MRVGVVTEVLLGCLAATGVMAATPAPSSPLPVIAVNPLREAYFGDLHLHTSYSLDAYLIGATKVNPDMAYRFAKGESIVYLGQRAQRREPLDFLAVTDHAENIGVLNELEDPDSEVSQSQVGKQLSSLLKSVTTPDGRRDFSLAHTRPGDADPLDAVWRDYVGGRPNKLPPELQSVPRAAWSREIDFANHNYEPGKFTTFIAYEWTSAPYAANLHRNVIFRGNSAPRPFSAFDSDDPRDLWRWLESIRNQGYEALAIPHNGNASNGLMYDWVTAPDYMDREYARHRQANEPLSEIAQNKGASETHPLLSPNDEFADYGIFDFMESFRHQVGRLQGSYLRDALGAGLVLQRQLGTNPFKYGFVGGSDFHSGLSVSAQADFAGSHWAANLGGGRPEKKQVIKSFSRSDARNDDEGGLGLKTSTGNLTAVWAESNTRESIYDALRRRETFATSGSKLKIRFFGGWNLSPTLLRQNDWLLGAYASGVPMGGDLPKKPDNATSPSFVIWAAKDPNGGNLDRVQVIKVWESAGHQQEKVFDAIWAGSRVPDRATGKLPPIGNTVDLASGHSTNSIGATQLATVWHDPQFDSGQAAAYYLRVLEIPTARWTTLLAIQYGVAPPSGIPATEQQRGWTSPIWYTPASP
jgi:hypothetical protein